MDTKSKFEFGCPNLCGESPLWSKLPDGENRYVCPKCHKILYITDDMRITHGHDMWVINLKII